jgi:hypothetical protein
VLVGRYDNCSQLKNRVFSVFAGKKRCIQKIGRRWDQAKVPHLLGLEAHGGRLEKS